MVLDRFIQIVRDIFASAQVRNGYHAVCVTSQRGSRIGDRYFYLCHEGMVIRTASFHLTDLRETHAFDLAVRPEAVVSAFTIIEEDDRDIFYLVLVTRSGLFL